MPVPRNGSLAPDNRSRAQESSAELPAPWNSSSNISLQTKPELTAEEGNALFDLLIAADCESRSYVLVNSPFTSQPMISDECLFLGSDQHKAFRIKCFSSPRCAAVSDDWHRRGVKPRGNTTIVLESSEIPNPSHSGVEASSIACSLHWYQAGFVPSCKTYHIQHRQWGLGAPAVHWDIFHCIPGEM